MWRPWSLGLILWTFLPSIEAVINKKYKKIFPLNVNLLSFQEVLKYTGTVVSGKTKLKCSFTLMYTPAEVDIKRSKIVCKPKNKKPVKIANYEIKNVVIVKLTKSKKTHKIMNQTVVIGSCRVGVIEFRN